MTRTEHTLARSKYARTKLRIFARRLRQWRTANKISRRDLAGRVGCSQGQLWNIEVAADGNERATQPSFSLYVHLCKEMGIEPLAGLKKALGEK